VTTNTARPTHVFVVGTGRSGTTTLSELLSSFPGAKVDHERDPKLLDEVRDFLEGTLPREPLLELLRRTRPPSPGVDVSGESNTQLSFVLPLLAEAYPSARVVWLIRDGRDVVASMVARGIYDPRELRGRGGAKAWARTRLQGDRVGDMSAEAWSQLEPFGRCCWLWAFTQRVVGRDLARLSLPWLQIRLEELDARTAALAAFCGVADDTAKAVPHSNRSRGKPRRSRSWSRKERDVFRQLCGPVMDEHYPGWEDDAVGRHVGADALSAASSMTRAAFVWSRSSLRARSRR
jgi:hypothetical protein